MYTEKQPYKKPICKKCSTPMKGHLKNICRPAVWVDHGDNNKVHGGHYEWETQRWFGGEWTPINENNTCLTNIYKNKNLSKLEYLFNLIRDHCTLFKQDLLFNGKEFWQPIKNELEKYDFKANSWKKLSRKKDKEISNKVMLLTEEIINAKGDKFIIEFNHFIIQQFRIPLEDEANLKKIFLIALNIGQYLGLDKFWNSYYDEEWITNNTSKYGIEFKKKVDLMMIPFLEQGVIFNSFDDYKQYGFTELSKYLTKNEIRKISKKIPDELIKYIKTYLMEYSYKN